MDKQVKGTENTPNGLTGRIKEKLLYSPFTYRIIDAFKGLFWRLNIIVNRCSLYGMGSAVLVTVGVKTENDRSRFIIKYPNSLRKINQIILKRD